jgi:spore coat polysaccharide biosynthesis protein SpsF
VKVAAIVPVSLSGGDGMALSILAGKPLLGHVCDRLAMVEQLATLLIVTTTAGADDPIEAFCAARGVACFRSMMEDELGRVLAALKSIEAKAAAIIRPNAPLIDPAIVTHVVNLVEMTDGMLDYIGTDLTPTYPRGMEVEAFTRAALDDADHRCIDPLERGSAGLFLRRNSRLYRLLGVSAPEALQRPDLRLDVDGEAALAGLESLLSHFAGRPDFSLGEMIAVLEAGPAARSPD